MAFVRPKARILELSTTSGSGPLALAGAPDNSYNRFSAFMSVGDQTYVTVVEPGVAFWTGIATYSAANQITLTTVEEAKGTFGAGTKEVMASPMASTSMFREDIAGAIVTGGTSTAYTVASYRKYATLAQLDGNIIAFTPHATNGQGATISIDGLATKPIRLVPGADLVPGVLIQGTPYLGLYNNTDGAFYLHGMSGMTANPYGVPLAASMDYWGSATPSSAFAFLMGQAISRTTYAALFALIGTTYGAGDGSTTFNLPDKRGRGSAGFDPGNATGRLNTGGLSAAILGSSGGEQQHTLTIAEIPAHTHVNSLSDPGHAHTQIVSNSGAAPGYPVNGNGSGVLTGTIQTASATTGVTLTNASQGGGGAHNIIGPTIVCNSVMRVL